MLIDRSICIPATMEFTNSAYLMSLFALACGNEENKYRRVRIGRGYYDTGPYHISSFLDVLKIFELWRCWKYETPVDREPAKTQLFLLEPNESLKKAKEISNWVFNQGLRCANIFHLLKAGVSPSLAASQIKIIACGTFRLWDSSGNKYYPFLDIQDGELYWFNGGCDLATQSKILAVPLLTAPNTAD